MVARLQRAARAARFPALVLGMAMLAGCGGPPRDGRGGGGTDDDATTGGEGDAHQAGSVFERSLLGPAARRAVEHARPAMPPGAAPVAFLLRADVAVPGEEEAGLTWYRLGLLLGPAGLRLFELSPRAIVEEEHGEDVGSVSADASELLAAVRAASAGEVPLLSEADCGALGGPSICGPLLELTAAATDPSEALGPDLRRLALVARALVVRGGDGAVVLDLTATGAARPVELGDSAAETPRPSARHPASH